jgi:hypothetical protein
MKMLSSIQHSGVERIISEKKMLDMPLLVSSRKRSSGFIPGYLVEVEVIGK